MFEFGVLVIFGESDSPMLLMHRISLRSTSTNDSSSVACDTIQKTCKENRRSRDAGSDYEYET